MAKYKVGDVVRIKTLEEMKSSGVDMFNENIPSGFGIDGPTVQNYLGKEVTIMEIVENSYITTGLGKKIGDQHIAKKIPASNDTITSLYNQFLRIPEQKLKELIAKGEILIIPDGHKVYWKSKGALITLNTKEFKTILSLAPKELYQGRVTHEQGFNFNFYDSTNVNQPIKESKNEDHVSTWTNPKPKIKNKRKIEPLMRVNVDGLEPLQEVERVTEKMVYLKNGSRVYKEKCFPVFKQLDTSVIKPGNIVMLKNIQSPQIVKSLGKYSLTVSGIDFTKDEVLEVWAKTPQEVEYKVYDCGTIEFQDKQYKSIEELKSSEGVFKLTKCRVRHSLLHKSISEHYSIEIEHIKPKETSISKVLNTTLNHPLNVEKKRWALLVGESGSGKTESAVQYCKDHNREYVKLQGTAQLTVDDIIGYKSLTTGEYIRSLLRDAVEFGKVFILDEIDSCNPNTLLVLNGLKQDYFQFPDELVKIHENFRLIATANTLEYSEKYNARAPMDKATKDRFKIIEYNMKPHELALRYGLEYVKDIKNIERLTPREIEGIVLDKRIQEMENA